MPAALALSSLLDTVAAERRRLRGEEVTGGLLSTVQSGLAAWETAMASFDAGGAATDALPSVAAAFTVTDETDAAGRAAADVVRMGVAKPVEILVHGLSQVYRELVRENREPVALVRKAATLERRSVSRWRPTESRRGLLVDRDLVLEEARVSARDVMRSAREVESLLLRWRSQPLT